MPKPLPQPPPPRDAISKGGRPAFGTRAPGQNPKIHITLTDKDRERLRLAAQALDISEAEIMRRGLTKILEEIESNYNILNK
jgi:hypothetical protein